ncbi:MAG: hypothetical protein F4107_02295 [Gemmatimonadetes bacterium]|nr:hypothetical protein [Gemmatimonadota bacterium]MYD12102.1 hypothetical protein [Gemmatimonadota bacterium]MYI64758.1 hypothetical protein [Gemmatimonadota bacterium]
MTQHTPHPSPEEDLAFIRRVMQGAREVEVDHSGHLILWGFLQAAAASLAYLVRQGAFYVSINVIWAVAVGIGFAGSWLLARRLRKSAPVNSLVNRVLAAIWVGCGLSLSLVGFLGAGTGSMPSPVAPGAKSVIIGCAFFASAPLFSRTAYWALAGAWWILGGALLVRPSLGSNLVFVCAPILFMLVPGLVLRTSRRTTPRLHVIA